MRKWFKKIINRIFKTRLTKAQLHLLRYIYTDIEIVLIAVFLSHTLVGSVLIRTLAKREGQR